MSIFVVSGIATYGQERRWKGRLRAEDAEKQLLQQVVPIVPESAKTANIGGKVELEARISPSGDVVEVHVLKGHPLLAPAAVEAVRHWKYKPFLKDGVPIEERVEVEIRMNTEIRPEEKEAFAEFSRYFSRGLSAHFKGNTVFAAGEFEKAIRVGEAFAHRRYLEFSLCLTSVGRLYLAEQRYADSEAALLRALKLRQLHQAPGEAEIAEVQFQLGALYHRTKKANQAVAAYREAISSWQTLLQETELPELLFSYTRSLAFASWNLANLMIAAGSPAEAESSYETAVKSGSRVLGETDMERLIDDFAKFLSKSGRKDEVSAMRERARRLRKDPANRLPPK